MLGLAVIEFDPLGANQSPKACEQSQIASRNSRSLGLSRSSGSPVAIHLHHFPFELLGAKGFGVSAQFAFDQRCPDFFDACCA